MKTQIFHNAKIQSSKNPLKETKILQDIIKCGLKIVFQVRKNERVLNILFGRRGNFEVFIVKRPRKV